MCERWIRNTWAGLRFGLRFGLGLGLGLELGLGLGLGLGVGFGFGLGVGFGFGLGVGFGLGIEVDARTAVIGTARIMPVRPHTCEGEGWGLRGGQKRGCTGA